MQKNTTFSLTVTDNTPTRKKFLNMGTRTNIKENPRNPKKTKTVSQKEV